MTDTVESLRAEIDKLRAELNDFKSYALPVINGHQPAPPDTFPPMVLLEFPEPPGREKNAGR